MSMGSVGGWGWQWGSSLVGGRTYSDKVLEYSPYAYWKLNEAAGASVAVCSVDSGQNGTPANVTFGSTTSPDGGNAPLFNGTSSSINIDTATLISNFDGTEGTVISFIKVFNAGVWEDTTERQILSLKVDNENKLRYQRDDTNNRISLNYEANNEGDSHNYDALSSTSWIHLAITWSDSGNAVVYYRDGANKVTDTNSQTWVGALDTAFIGMREADSRYWYGYICHVALFPDVKSDANILDLATV